MKYVTISDIKELAMIGVVAGKGTASAPPNCFATPSLKIDFSKCAGQL
jgi:hypothetical protein